MLVMIVMVYGANNNSWVTRVFTCIQMPRATIPMTYRNWEWNTIPKKDQKGECRKTLKQSVQRCEKTTRKQDKVCMWQRRWETSFIFKHGSQWMIWIYMLMSSDNKSNQNLELSVSWLSCDFEHINSIIILIIIRPYHALHHHHTDNDKNEDNSR